MQIVIDIPEEMYAELIDENGMATMLIPCSDIIRNGTPLPKGHGRLIDADAFIAMMKDVSKRHKYKELLINDCLTVDDVFKAVIESLQNRGLAEGDAPTIIEADDKENKKMLNIPDWNKDDYDRQMDEYPDYEDELDDEWNLEDSIQDSIWRGCIEDK